MSREGVVFDVKEFAVFDGPGIRTTVFMKGCPLRCAWCHNPEGLAPAPQLMVSRAACTHCGACRRICPHPDACTACGECVAVCPGGYRRIAGQTYSADDLAARLQKDADVYRLSGGGVTFSGGEPLMQWAFVREVISRLSGVHTAIETSGFCADEVFAQAIETVSLIMMDWKVSDPALHKRWTGVSQDPILRHLNMLCAGDTPFILRMPIIPGVNDNPEHLRPPPGWSPARKRLCAWRYCPISALRARSMRWSAWTISPALTSSAIRVSLLKPLSAQASPINSSDKQGASR